jgi:branched-chain amino acid transport system permease protein
VLIFSAIGISLVVLTGWAGQVSLGQMTFVGAGGAVAAWATVERGLDPLVALLAAGLVGAVVAVIVGLPALRLRGLYLAVTTLALALAASDAVFSNAYWDWIPTGTFARPKLLGRVSLDSATRVYYLALVVLLLTIVAVVGLRHSRIGRVLVAQRDNETAAAAYGISVTRAKLCAFAVSGFVAALAGATFVFHQASFRAESYDAGQSLIVFAATVTGGLGSVVGAVIGAVYARGAQWLLSGNWQILASSVGVLAVLMVMPDGLSGIAFRIRDAGLRWLAVRRGIDAPSLVRSAAPAPDPDPLDEAA